MSEFLDRAFGAHAAVKDKLRKAILGLEAIDPATLRRDDVCSVGQWIHGEGGTKHRDNPLFRSFKAVHAEFHEAAYNALMLAKQSGVDAAVEAIEHGAFQKKSAEIGLCIGKMKKDPALH